MIKTVFWSKKFKQDYKRLVNSESPATLKEFLAVIELLANGQTLPEKYKDHLLKGNWKGYRECHIKPDLLLIYKLENDKITLTLVRAGSHSELF